MSVIHSQCTERSTLSRHDVTPEIMKAVCVEARSFKHGIHTANTIQHSISVWINIWQVESRAKVVKQNCMQVLYTTVLRFNYILYKIPTHNYKIGFSFIILYDLQRHLKQYLSKKFTPNIVISISETAHNVNSKSSANVIDQNINESWKQFFPRISNVL